MKSVFTFLFRGFVSVNVGALSGFIAFLGLNASFGMSVLAGLIGGASSYTILKWRGKQKVLSQNQLTRKEFKYIQSNLQEAKEKIKRLNNAFVGNRSIYAMRQIGKLRKMVNRIYQIVKNEPKRFYQAEKFFFYHLDSVVELSERYVFLTRQPVKDKDVRRSLSETEVTLKHLIQSLEEDLLNVLSNDIDHLNFELDVAKHTLRREKNMLPKERD
ncbi:5-bromo-4-chloroindolyl phosphate hydrolysis family protein [Anaerobacillus sp. MEB173]|uniref:5-bromo-4-chloroindolyl phosphate hydrolysis family protein n=1 Tax=Anaerobacillus sp. MEB173 TaxID=3383345 RepID=UPI003F935ABB